MTSQIVAVIGLIAAAGAAERPVVNVVPNPASSTGGIQEAIDSLGSEGGTVHIPAGEYLLRSSIIVRSQITIRGAGAETVLRKVEQAGSRLAAPADKEDRFVDLESTKGFMPGDAIGIFDRETVGWLHSRAIVKEVVGNRLLLDRRVARMFDPAKYAGVVNFFPAISGVTVDGAVIRDLTIDGERERNPGVTAVAPRGLELGFNFAAINLVDATNTRIKNCLINGWPSDGISMQRGSGNRVTGCVVERCRGEGYHPGGGLRDSVFSDNVARANIGNGFFFCARVENVTVKNNRFIENARSGIGDLGRSGDTRNTVEDNLCEGNGMAGIEVRDGEGNSIRRNICKNNSRLHPGKYSGIQLSATARSTVSDNRCFDDQATKTQKHGIEERADCRENVITGNDCRHNAESGFALAGQASVHRDNLGTQIE